MSNASAFYDYVRGLTDVIPPAYSAKGMAVYRYHVRLGVVQMIDSIYPDLCEQLGEEAWELLITDFIQKTQWSSHFYDDLRYEFVKYLERENQELSD